MSLIIHETKNDIIGNNRTKLSFGLNDIHLLLKFRLRAVFRSAVKKIRYG